MDNTILKMEGITRRFPGVVALNNVTFELRAGEVHVLCGENGAGKSTLMKILAGLYRPSEGKIFLEGKEVSFDSPLDSEKSGVGIVYQEISLCPTINVAENIFLGLEKTHGKVMLNKKLMHSETVKIFDMLKCKINPNALLGTLDIAQQQLVQIAKALYQQPNILIMDEPFSSLSIDESETMFGIMEILKKQGVGIIYIDHRIDNFFRIGDRLTVLRDGNYIGTKDMSEVDRDQIISMMVGRDITDIYPKSNVVKNEVVFEVKGLSTAHVDDISFDVRRGEIFGFGGLVGAGRTEILRGIFGADKKAAGSVTLEGRTLKINNQLDGIKNGIALVPESRKSEGLVLIRSIKFNATLVIINKLRKMLAINKKKELETVDKYVGDLNIKVSNINNDMDSLSGGNQQKVVLAKWLMMNNIKVLMLDEPTRGIDVGAKHEIYKLMSDLANRGITIIMVSSELPEILNLCDRIAVVKNGKINGILSREELSQEKVMDLSV